MASLSIHSLSVTIAAALYTMKPANGGKMLKSMACSPSMNGSRLLVIVERTVIRDVVAIELQNSVTSALRGALLPCSKASRRALCTSQHRFFSTSPNLTRSSSRVTKCHSTSINRISVSSFFIQKCLEIYQCLHGHKQLVFLKYDLWYRSGHGDCGIMDLIKE